MSKLNRALAGMVLALGGLARLRVRAGNLSPSLFAYVGKQIGQMWAPVLAFAGAVSALFGLERRDFWTTVGGAGGAVLLIDFLRGVLRPRADFESAFGADWRTRLPAGSTAHLPRSRWSGFLPTPPLPPVQWDLPFWTLPGGERRLLCDLWQPAPGVPRSGLGILFFHAGGWQNFDKDSGTRPFFSHLTTQGHVIMDVAYRLSDETDMAGMLDDVRRAIVWLRRQASVLKLVPKHLVLMGGSAGAHLALLSAYAQGWPETLPEDLRGEDFSVRGVVSYYGPTDLGHFWAIQRRPDWRIFVWAGRRLGFVTSKEYLPWPQAERRLLGGGECDLLERSRLFSPITYVGPHCPPTLLLHGAHDRIVSVEDSRRLFRALRQQGVPAVYLELPRVDHVFDMPMLCVSPAAQAAFYEVSHFLALMAGREK